MFEVKNEGIFEKKLKENSKQFYDEHSQSNISHLLDKFGLKSFFRGEIL
jgi:hypothetical protein